MNSNSIKTESRRDEWCWMEHRYDFTHNVGYKLKPQKQIIQSLDIHQQDNRFHTVHKAFLHISRLGPSEVIPPHSSCNYPQHTLPYHLASKEMNELVLLLFKTSPPIVSWTHPILLLQGSRYKPRGCRS